MNVLRGLGFVWIALMFSGYSLAASTSTIDDVLVASGFTRHMDRVPAEGAKALSQSIEQLSGAAMPRMVNGVIGNQLQQWWSPASLKASLTQDLARTLSDMDARALLAWFKSPEGAAVTHAEVQSGHAAVGGVSNQKAYSDERLAIARRIDQHIGVSALAIFMQEATVQGLHSYGVKSGSSKSRPSPQVVERRVARQLADTYHQLPDSTLVAYEAFLGSESAAKFHGSVQRVLKAEYQDGLRAMLNDVGPMLAMFLR